MSNEIIETILEAVNFDQQATGLQWSAVRKPRSDRKTDVVYVDAHGAGRRISRQELLKHRFALAKWAITLDASSTFWKGEKL